MMQKIPNYILFRYFSIAIIVGIALASFIVLDWQRSWQTLLVAILLLGILAILMRLFNLRFLPSTAVIIIIIIFGAARYYQHHNNIEMVSRNVKNGNADIEATIVSDPEISSTRQSMIVKIDNVKYKSNESAQEYNYKIFAQTYLDPYPEYSYGDKLSIIGCIKDPKITPTFNQEKYLKPKRVTKIIECFPQVEKTGKEITVKTVLIGGLYNIREEIDKSIARSYSEPYASLASGLILGGSKKMSEGLQDAFSRTSLTHIVALSGYNVTIIIAVITGLLIGAIGRKKSFYVGIALVLLFILMTGAASSIIRAGIFSLLIIYGRTIGRRGNQTNILLLTAIIMLVINPYLLRYDMGFQLSFLAFTGLIYLAPVLRNIARRVLKREMPDITSVLWDTLAAQLMVLPTILYNFGTISYIAPLANMAVLWIVPLAMAASALTAIVGLMYLPLGHVFGFITQIILKYIIFVVEKFSSFKYAATNISVKNPIIPISIYLIIVITSSYILKKGEIKKYLVSKIKLLADKYEEMGI
jgi:competence protein ComEC